MRWLYNSGGQPIAYVDGENVFSSSGRFVGRLSGNEVWHGAYIGEIVNGDRLLRRTYSSTTIRGIPGIPGTPGIPGRPGNIGVIGIPGGYEDVNI